MDYADLSSAEKEIYNSVAGYVGAIPDDDQFEEALDQYVGARPNVKRALRQARRADRRADRRSRGAEVAQSMLTRNAEQNAQAIENTFDNEDALFVDATAGKRWRRVSTVVPIGSQSTTGQNSVQSILFTAKPVNTFKFTAFDDVEFVGFDAYVLQSAANAARIEQTLLAGIGVSSIKIGNIDFFESNHPSTYSLAAFLREYNDGKMFKRMVLEKSQVTGLTFVVNQIGSGADGTLGADVDLWLGARVRQVKPA